MQSSQSNVVSALFPSKHDISKTIREVADSLNHHANKLDDCSLDFSSQYSNALDILEKCEDYVIVSGMGKSGHIGGKLAATLASTGTAAFFVHPGEALHGDLGMFKPNTVVILISNSGSTKEIVSLLPSLEVFGCKIIAMTGDVDSPLGRAADAVLDIHVSKEICPNNLAPTTSTTLTAVVGDAVAVELMKRKQFKPLDFAKYHPGGALGQKLLTRVSDNMKTELPKIDVSADWGAIVDAIEKGGIGAAIVQDLNGELAGVITDGDIRRVLADEAFKRGDCKASDFMTASPLTICEEARMCEAETLMRREHVSVLLVTGSSGYLVGAVEYAS